MAPLAPPPLSRFSRPCCQSLFFNNVAGIRPVSLLKTDSDKVAVLRDLENFYKHLFYRTPPVTASELICSWDDSELDNCQRFPMFFCEKCLFTY